MAKPEVRLAAVRAAFAAGVGLLVLRAAQVQLVDGERYAAIAASQRTDSVALPARRGGLYDRNGVPLATTLERFHVGIAGNELHEPDRALRLASRQLGLSEREVRRATRRRWAYFHGTFTSAQVHPLRQVHGIYLTSEFARFYPDPDLAVSVLGRPAAAGRPAGGIERVLDSVLAGRPGRAVEIRDGRGRVYESPSRLSAFPAAGHDVWLTIDAQVQEIVQTALANAIDRYAATGGDVVVLEPRSGEVLAAASLHGGDTPGAGVFTSVFEPGSTVKIFVAAALLSLGRVGERDTVYGEGGRWVLPNRVLEDDHDYDFSWMTLSQAIRVSSNIGTAKFASRLSPEEQFTFLRAFGFGTPTGVEQPAESRGRLKRPGEWSGTTPVALAIGYELSVTPIQLAQAYAAIANGGRLTQPTLIKETRTPAGRLTYRHVPEPVRQAVTPEVAERLRRMLRSVTGEGGTGATAALSVYEVAGKTGTARVAGPGGYIPGAHVAVFASLFPADDPQLVMVVKLENPRGGYATLSAAPLTRRVLEQVLAARTGALDPLRLPGRVAPRPAAGSAARRAGPSLVVPWPDTASVPSPAARTVPDVSGLALREAVRRLHRAGLRVRVEGRGSVTATVPAAGSEAQPGTVVQLVTSPRTR